MIFMILLLTVITLLAYLSWRSSSGEYAYWKKCGVPVAPGCLPIIGHMWPLLTSRMSFYELVDHFVRMFGDYSMIGFNHSGIPTLIITEPALAKTVLQTNFSSFHANKLRIDPELDPLLAKNPFFCKGEAWLTARKNLTYAFTSARLKVLAETVREVGKRFETYVDKKLKGRDTVEMELKDLFSRYTGEVVANVGFGVQGFCFDEEDHPMSFINIGNELFAPSIFQILSVFFPQLSKFIRLRFVPKKIDKFFRDLVRQILEQRKKETVRKNDFFQLMIDRERLEGEKIDEEVLAAVTFSFYVDGHETSNTTLSFVGYNLARNPDVQEKLREHVVEVLRKHDDVINAESLKEMTYLEQVIHESMRMESTVLALLKTCTEEFELQGSDGISCRVKPGTEIVVPARMFHKDPRYWNNPEIFDPDRFDPARKDELTRYAFLPFGEGPRICVGMRMAMLQMKAAIATVVKNYSMTLSSKTQLPLKRDSKSILSYPIGGLWVNIKRI